MVKSGFFFFDTIVIYNDFKVVIDNIDIWAKQCMEIIVLCNLTSLF